MRLLNVLLGVLICSFLALSTYASEPSPPEEVETSGSDEVDAVEEAESLEAEISRINETLTLIRADVDENTRRLKGDEKDNNNSVVWSRTNDILTGLIAIGGLLFVMWQWRTHHREVNAKPTATPQFEWARDKDGVPKADFAIQIENRTKADLLIERIVYSHFGDDLPDCPDKIPQNRKSVEAGQTESFPIPSDVKVKRVKTLQIRGTTSNKVWPVNWPKSLEECDREFIRSHHGIRDGNYFDSVLLALFKAGRDYYAFEETLSFNSALASRRAEQFSSRDEAEKQYQEWVRHFQSVYPVEVTADDPELQIRLPDLGPYWDE